MSGLSLFTFAPFESKLPTFTRLPSESRLDCIAFCRPWHHPFADRSGFGLSCHTTRALCQSNSPALAKRKQCYLASDVRERRFMSLIYNSKFLKNSNCRPERAAVIHDFIFQNALFHAGDRNAKKRVRAAGLGVVHVRAARNEAADEHEVAVGIAPRSPSVF